MNKHIIRLILFCLTALSFSVWAIDESAVIKIAEQAAGCGVEKSCETRASTQGGQWIVIVSTIYGHRENGEPIFKPGGWVGFTLDQEGNIVGTMPGL